MGKHPARTAPANTEHEWWDTDGVHTAKVGPSGVFHPADAAQAAYADSRGWPVAPKPNHDAAPAAPEGDAE